MSTNNFKKIDEEMREIHPKPPAEIESNIASNVHTYTIFGKVVELFIPRIFDSLINMVGGKGSKRQVNDSPTRNNNNLEASRGNAKSDEASNRGDIVM